jgi:hypothetical protein
MPLVRQFAAGIGFGVLFRKTIELAACLARISSGIMHNERVSRRARPVMGETPDSAAQPATSTTESGTGEAMAAGAATPRAQPAKAVAVDPHPARQLPDPSIVKTGWWFFAVLLLAAAVIWSFVVAFGTAFSHGHRLSAAAAALLDVVALATLAHVLLLWYQSGSTDVPADGPSQETLSYRRRGLKAALIGQDGRASTSKTQVVLWTGAVVWALFELLLLARSYPGGNLFTGAVTSNWRPEYLVLLGLPVAAAATAKAVVSGSNGGRGPLTKSQAEKALGKAARVYERYPVPPGVIGFQTGVAELITGDDRTVSWADLQYVVFTLITLIYFVVQVLTQPQHGLPPVPAALLTLMGVSASGYMATKIVESKGTVLA